MTAVGVGAATITMRQMGPIDRAKGSGGPAAFAFRAVGVVARAVVPSAREPPRMSSVFPQRKSGSEPRLPPTQ